jgi:hypothetical protein
VNGKYRNVEGRDHLKDLVESGNSNKMDVKEVGGESVSE